MTPLERVRRIVEESANGYICTALPINADGTITEADARALESELYRMGCAMKVDRRHDVRSDLSVRIVPA